MLAFIIAVIVSLEADFTQTKQSALMNEPQVSKGHLIYRAPDYMQWAYTSPQAIQWEIDGNTTNVNPQIQKLLRMIMSSIAGNSQEDEVGTERFASDSQHTGRAEVFAIQIVLLCIG